MTARLCLCLGIAALLASCDKPKDSGKATSASDSKTRVARGKRPPGTQAPRPEKELRAALATAKQIESPEARDVALAEVAWGALEVAPELSIDAFKRISTDSPEKVPLIQYFAMQLMEKSPDEALAWAAALGSEKEIAIAKDAIVQFLAGSDPERAAKLLAKSGTPGREFDNTSVYVLQRWIATAPADAAAWVVALPPGDASKVAIKTVVSDWVQTDSPAAFSWIATIRKERVRKEAISAMVATLAEIPQPIRQTILEPVDSALRSEVEQQIDQIAQEEKQKMEAANPTPEPPAPEPPASEPPPVVVAPEVPVTDVPAPEAPMQEEPAGEEPAEDEPEEPESSE